MRQLPNLNDTSYVNQILPELIWIGLINDKLGYVQGTRLIEEIFKATDEFSGNDVLRNFAYASSFGMLDEDEKKALVKKLSALEILDLLKNYLAPLTLLYDEFPMRFIGPPDTIIKNEILIQSISKSVDKHRDKYKTEGVVLIGAAFLARLVTRKIQFSSSLSLPDFNSIIDAPGSEEAKRASGFIRANSLAEFGMLKIKVDWARYFWNRGYELSPCKTLWEN
jgi:hypothetical protein